MPPPPNQVVKQPSYGRGYPQPPQQDTFARGKAAAFDSWLAQGGVTFKYSGRFKKDGPLKGKTYDEAKAEFENMWAVAPDEVKEKYASRSQKTDLAPSERKAYDEAQKNYRQPVVDPRYSQQPVIDAQSQNQQVDGFDNQDYTPITEVSEDAALIGADPAQPQPVTKPLQVAGRSEDYNLKSDGALVNNKVEKPQAAQPAPAQPAPADPAQPQPMSGATPAPVTKLETNLQIPNPQNAAPDLVKPGVLPDMMTKPAPQQEEGTPLGNFVRNTGESIVRNVVQLNEKALQVVQKPFTPASEYEQKSNQLDTKHKLQDDYAKTQIDKQSEATSSNRNKLGLPQINTQPVTKPAPTAGQPAPVTQPIPESAPTPAPMTPPAAQKSRVNDLTGLPYGWRPGDPTTGFDPSMAKAASDSALRQSQAQKAATPVTKPYQPETRYTPGLGEVAVAKPVTNGDEQISFDRYQEANNRLKTFSGTDEQHQQDKAARSQFEKQADQRRSQASQQADRERAGQAPTPAKKPFYTGSPAMTRSSAPIVRRETNRSQGWGSSMDKAHSRTGYGS